MVVKLENCEHVIGILQLDKREPDVLRVGLCPLYVSFHDCHRFVDMLTEALHAVTCDESTKKTIVNF